MPKGMGKDSQNNEFQAGPLDLVRLEIGDELDLHTFDPQDVGSLIPDYLMACMEAGIRSVRIIHGKGTGALRRSVQAILGRIDIVQSYRLGGAEEGHWGATVVFLKRKETKRNEKTNKK